jgi:hypothetical protein
MLHGRKDLGKYQAPVTAGFRMIAKAGAEADPRRFLTFGLHIVDRRVTSPNEVIFDLSFDGEQKGQKFVLKKVGDEWKLHDILFD